MNSQKEATKRQRLRDIENKKYYCIDCDKAFRDKTALNLHLGGLKHHPERRVKYECVKCNYSTGIKSHLRTHERSRKHIRNNEV